jgi:hypothetical protein
VALLLLVTFILHALLLIALLYSTWLSSAFDQQDLHPHHYHCNSCHPRYTKSCTLCYYYSPTAVANNSRLHKPYCRQKTETSISQRSNRTWHGMHKNVIKVSISKDYLKRLYPPPLGAMMGLGILMLSRILYCK